MQSISIPTSSARVMGESQHASSQATIAAESYLLTGHSEQRFGQLEDTFGFNGDSYGEFRYGSDEGELAVAKVIGEWEDDQLTTF